MMPRVFWKSLAHFAKNSLNMDMGSCSGCGLFPSSHSPQKNVGYFLGYSSGCLSSESSTYKFTTHKLKPKNSPPVLLDQDGCHIKSTGHDEKHHTWSHLIFTVKLSARFSSCGFDQLQRSLTLQGTTVLKKKYIYIYIYIYTSQIGERKIIFKHTLGADTLVPRRVDTKVIILPTTEINVASSDPSQSGYSNWIIDWYNGHEEDIRGRCSMWRVPFKALPRLRSWSSTTGTRRWKEDDFQAKISPC